MTSEALIHELIRSAIDAVRPEFFIPDTIGIDRNRLTVRGRKAAGYCEYQDIDPDAFDHLYIVSVGKAAVGMAEAADGLLGSRITEGIVLTKHVPAGHRLGDRYRIFCGGHPVPTEESVRGAEAILKMLDKAGCSDLVLFLISGGGSALMAAPFDGISLEMYRDFCSAILGCGADIGEFNTIRKHLDKVKGGRLALHAAPARQVTIILSDVVGSPKEVIASGPTVPDPSTYRDALEILNRYAGKAHFPPGIREILVRGVEGELPETPGPDDGIFRNSSVFLAADNRTAADAAAKRAAELKIPAEVIAENYTGEASLRGASMPALFDQMKGPGVFVLGGETTVTLRGKGLGGRNLEMALAAVRPMSALPGCTMVTLATDGEDGPTDAAGAVVTSGTLSAALERGCDPEEYLRNNDSYHFFESAGGLIKTGPTGTNVNDLTFLIRR
ncbi:MAG: DUF4147 domain-containing protein [Flexilinea sp.]|nr:DUF4147 domain-containing protein [Flexilinea sp.]